MSEPSVPTESSRGSCIHRFGGSIWRLITHKHLPYSFGHVLNDLCASMWFTYLLVFYHFVLQFSNTTAGLIMLLGQTADAICTPFIGYESDHTSGCCGYTKRKSWHALGSACVALTFPFLFMYCIGCGNASDWAQFIYYAPFVVIFQFGWASTQISHLSLIPELTADLSERVQLNALRYAFTVISNLTIYVIAWVLLNLDQENVSITPHDASKFQMLALIAVGIGVVFSLIFHVGTHENRSQCESSSQVDHSINNLRTSHNVGYGMKSKDWLKEYQFYQVALLYMCTRLILNLSQIYLPMYLTDTLKMSKQYIAIVPLVVFLSSLVSSFFMKSLNRLIGRKVTFFVGCCLTLGSSAWFYFLHSPVLMVFGPAILQGAGSATLLVTSLSMTADLIGEHTGSGAFVYGVMSFTDKLSNGLAVVLIQQLHPCKTAACCPACVWYYRDTLSFVPGGVAIVAVMVLLTLLPVQLGNLRKFPQIDISNVDIIVNAEEQAPLLGNTAPPLITVQVSPDNRTPALTKTCQCQTECDCTIDITDASIRHRKNYNSINNVNVISDIPSGPTAVTPKCQNEISHS